MSDYFIAPRTSFVATSDAIREKTGLQDGIVWGQDGFASTLNSLTAYANSVTGESDTNLSDAVASLVDGYGGGGVTDTFAEICNGSITSYESDALIKIPGNTLRNSATTLTSIKAPNLEDIGSYGLAGYKGTVIAMPGFKGDVYNDGYAFSGAPNLTTVDIGVNAVRFYSGFFSGATKLNILIIRATAVPTLNNINAFNNTPFASGKAGGTLYVPNSLISSYQSASNWSTILGYSTNSIQKIEGSAYENAYADGTPISS